MASRNSGIVTFESIFGFSLFAPPLELPAQHYQSYATCGGGNCYSNGLKKCVKCGSTSKPKPKPKPAAKPRCSGGNCYSSGLKKCVRCGSTSSSAKKCGSGMCYSNGLQKCVKCGSTSSKAAPKLSCNLSGSLCLANNPRASSCGVTRYTNGGCSCNCKEKGTGARLGPAPKKGSVAREDPQTTSTGGIRPGTIPAGTQLSQITPANTRFGSFDIATLQASPPDVHAGAVMDAARAGEWQKLKLLQTVEGQSLFNITNKLQALAENAKNAQDPRLKQSYMDQICSRVTQSIRFI